MRKFVIVLLASVPCLVAAQEASDPRAEIAGLVPGLTAEDVRPSVVEGLYEVAIGSQIVYVTGDSRYLIKGDIVDLETNHRALADLLATDLLDRPAAIQSTAQGLIE